MLLGNSFDESQPESPPRRMAAIAVAVAAVIGRKHIGEIVAGNRIPEVVYRDRDLVSCTLAANADLGSFFTVLDGIADDIQNRAA